MSTPRSVLVLNHSAVGRDAPGGTRHVEMFDKLAGWSYTLIAADRNLFDRRRHRSASILTVPTIPYRSNGAMRVLNWLSYATGALLRGAFIKRPDVVYASSPHLFAGLAGWLLARMRRAVFVLEIRDLWPEILASMGRMSEQSMLFRALRRLELFLYRSADHIVVLAAGVVETVAQHGIPKEKITFLPNAADPSDFSVSTTREEAKRRMRFEGFVATYAGAHGPANGLELLLSAAQRLERNEVEMTIVLVGDGPSKASLVDMARKMQIENVRFMDPIPKADIPMLLAASDVGVHVLADVPLFRFGVSPNKLCDYMAAGLPVVTNSPGEAGDLVRVARAGIVTEPDRLHEGLAHVARASGPDLARWGESGRAFMEKNRSRTMVARDLARLLDGLVDSPVGGSQSEPAVE